MEEAEGEKEVGRIGVRNCEEGTGNSMERRKDLNAEIELCLRNPILFVSLPLAAYSAVLPVGIDS